MTANLSCRTTSWRQSKSNWGGRHNCPCPCTRLWSEEKTPMATSVQRASQLSLADMKGKVDPDWCPGCGDFGVLAAVQKALVELRIPIHNVVTISGIGCSSNFPGYMNTYGMHTLHGRGLAVATGLKLANHELTGLVTGRDGDGFRIGGKPFVHPMPPQCGLAYI